MGADYVIHYACEPKNALTLDGLLARLKGRERAAAIIDLYRERGDARPATHMGFEMVRRLPDGSEEREVLVVQDLLDAAEALRDWEPVCAQCPANRTGVPFGCVGVINYPISIRAERWLLDQLPDSEHPLPYMLLQRAVFEMGYTGENAAALRAQTGVFFESAEPLIRDLDAMPMSGDQVFELLFLSGHIRPAHGTMLLQFLGAISQDLDADTIMQLPCLPRRSGSASMFPSGWWTGRAMTFRSLRSKDFWPRCTWLTAWTQACCWTYKARK